MNRNGESFEEWFAKAMGKKVDNIQNEYADMNKTDIATNDVSNCKIISKHINNVTLATLTLDLLLSKKASEIKDGNDICENDSQLWSCISMFDALSKVLMQQLILTQRELTQLKEVVNGIASSKQ